MQTEKNQQPEKWERSIQILKEIKEQFLDVSNDEIIEMKIQKEKILK